MTSLAIWSALQAWKTTEFCKKLRRRSLHHVFFACFCQVVYVIFCQVFSYYLWCVSVGDVLADLVVLTWAKFDSNIMMLRIALENIETLKKQDELPKPQSKLQDHTRRLSKVTWLTYNKPFFQKNSRNKNQKEKLEAPR